MGNIIVTTECVADIPADIVKKYNIGIIYYTIKTDKGEFRDTDEITSMNVMEYMMGGEKKALSIIPTVDDYLNFFSDCLEKYDEIIHISISSDVSTAYANAKTAIFNLKEAGKNISLIDSRHLSSGQGLLVIEAARATRTGKSREEIVEYIDYLVPRVHTSFIAYNADYLYYNGKVPQKVMDLCQKFYLHPVLAMVNGKLTLKGVYIGLYEKATKKYLKKVIANNRKIKKDFGFLTYAGCSHKNLEYIYNLVQNKVGFNTLLEQQASATVSCNCGPNTFGVLYITKD